MEADRIIRQWTRLGIAFNVHPFDQTPDIERLLMDTASVLPKMPRLLPACVSWLTRYYRLVCRHRLAGLAAGLGGTDASASLGLLLDFAKASANTDHFNLAIKLCAPTQTSKPLFTVDRLSEPLASLARLNSSPIGRRWGLWCENVELKEDAIRPLAWVMEHNPTLKWRAVFGGNLRASILEILSADQQAGQSESLLARRCHATRKAVREALDHLEFCRLVLRRSAAGKILISLCG
ncbi:MAG: hypothetical protein L0Y36_05685 [Planctomycetales bacterium]|nr:hypothetical protein [Planctomycetales bacterium]